MIGAIRVALDRIGAFGNGESADAARRTFQPMCQKDPLPRFGSGQLLPHRQRLLNEQVEHLASEGLIAHRLAREMIEVDRRCL
jgi:hypothetical protein